MAAAHYLLKQSHKLVVVSRTTSALTQLRDQYGADKVEIVAGDLSDFNISRRAVEVANDRFGRIDGLLINHGALDPVKKVADSTAEEWRKAFDTNVFSAIALVRIMEHIILVDLTISRVMTDASLNRSRLPYPHFAKHKAASS